MAVLICGSFAFDTIMVFQDRFKNHILPEKVHILNVSFQVPKMRREFGGCAGNIAFNFKLLGGDPLPMGTVGEDFEPYARWMDRHGIPRTHVEAVPGAYTAQAFITTDMDDNQITAFHPGAMNESQRTRVRDAKNVSLGIVAPDGREGMLAHARDFAERNIPFIFDPGQGMPLFDGADLERFVAQASYLTLNDYEARLFEERTGKPLAQHAKKLRAAVVTKGAEGSEIFAGGERHDIPCVKAKQVVDPTGCGDAYRAALLFGIERGLDWPTTGRIAALMGAIKIAHSGTQNHAFEMVEFRDRFRAEFGYVF